MPTILDADDSFLSAQATVEEWHEEFMAEWLKPIREMALMMMWSRLPPAGHDYLQQTAPEGHAKLQEMITEIEGRRERNGR